MSSSGSCLPELGEHLVGRGLDDLRARVEVLVDAVAEAHQLEASCSCPWPAPTYFFTSPPSLWMASEHLEHLLVRAAVQRAPERADAGADRREEVRLARADDAHRARRAVLLVIGVQDEQKVHHLHELGVDLVLLGRDREHHVEEVRAVRQRVLRVDERLPDGLLVRERRDRPHLRDEARDRDVAHVDVVDVERVRVVARQRRDHRAQDGHRVGRRREALEEVLHVLVKQRVARELLAPRP